MGQLRHRTVFRRAFVLLEVMVAMVIIAVGLVALMKGFVLSLDTLKRVKLNEQAILLARTLMDDMIMEPPAEGRYDGEFSLDSRFGEDFKGWFWELDVEAEEPDYEERPPGKLQQDLEAAYIVNIRILHEDAFGEKSAYIDIDTIQLEADIYSIPALQENQIF